MSLHLAKRWGAVGGLVLLAACASDPNPTMSRPNPALDGIWVVTDAFPAGAVTDTASAPRGQRVRLDAGMASDPAGRLCPWPSFADHTARLGEAIEASGGFPALDVMVAVLEVRCANAPFSRYAVLADGSLLHRHGPWLLRLEQGEKLARDPAPLSPAESPMVMMAAPVPLPPPMAAEPPPSGPPVLVYLASYKTEAWARKGWTVLTGQSATLKGLEPVTRGVEIQNKGKFVRLFAPAKDIESGKAICRDLGKTLGECGVPGREKATSR
jgi:hypothetical protein